MKARTRWPRIALVVIAAAALTTISLGANPRFALVSAVSAVAISLTRVRYATAVAAILLLAGAALSIAAPREEGVYTAAQAAGRSGVATSSRTHRHDSPRPRQNHQDGGDR